jgi:tRNA pseudouridine38-40 synthase
MPRYKLLIEYDGGGLSGWQRQENGPSVQAAIEAAAQGLSGESVTVFGSGRTDAGVHALGQAAHFDLEKVFEGWKLREALNFHLKGQAISVLDVEVVDEEFHARFSATGRAYRYRIINRLAPLALERHRAWLVHQPLDAEAMHRAAQALIGKHDFTTFRAAACQAKSPLKTLDVLSVERTRDEIIVRAEARSFLHNQVRAIVGSLKMVGEGKWPEARMSVILEARDRASCGATAPAHGLYLENVSFD